jgi:hypothetical protein
MTSKFESYSSHYTALRNEINDNLTESERNVAHRKCRVAIGLLHAYAFDLGQYAIFSRDISKLERQGKYLGYLIAAAFAVVAIVNEYFLSEARPLSLGHQILGIGLLFAFFALRHDGIRNMMYLQRSLVEQNLRTARRELSLVINPSLISPTFRGLNPLAALSLWSKDLSDENFEQPNVYFRYNELEHWHVFEEDGLNRREREEMLTLIGLSRLIHDKLFCAVCRADVVWDAQEKVCTKFDIVFDNISPFSWDLYDFLRAKEATQSERVQAD